MTTDTFPRFVLVDCNFLIANADPKTNDLTRARIDNFFVCAEKAKSRVILPMPAIAEYLVKADQAALKTLYALEKKSYIFAAPFDRKAAIECALLDGAAMGKGDKKDGSSEPWQKIKIDRQIIAIGRAHNVSLIISSDKNLKANADRVAIPCLEIDDLELPDSSKQQALFKTSK